MHLGDAVDQAAMRRELSENTLPRMLGDLERRAHATGPFFCGDKVQHVHQ